MPVATKRSRKPLPKVVCIVGATSSGKTTLGIQIAQAFDGEVVNADARQIYRHVSIGTGKPTGASKLYKRRYRAFMYKGIPHYLMDFLPPTEQYSVSEWKASAMKAIKGIVKRKHLPIVVGGTGLYISSIVDNLEIPEVPPQILFRKEFESKTLDELVHFLLHLDPEAAAFIDLKNKRRVIRALEIMTFTGEKISLSRKKGPPLVDVLQIGIDYSMEELTERTSKAIDGMIEQGLFSEVEALMEAQIPDTSPAFTSIGYPGIIKSLRGEISRDEAINNLKKLTRAYVKRQITWFKRDPRIVWVKSRDEGVEVVRKWLAGQV
ncbi:MAG: tRNA (adenosine(37)-N6)-dimethylallyltransferase MiaA [Patescibacteria group bacterium]